MLHLALLRELMRAPARVLCTVCCSHARTQEPLEHIYIYMMHTYLYAYVCVSDRNPLLRWTRTNRVRNERFMRCLGFGISFCLNVLKVYEPLLVAFLVKRA